MARSRPEGVTTNPVERWLEWSGSKGQLYYYDKAQQEKVYLDKLPKFAVLEERFLITGFSDDKQLGIRSTEHKSIKESMTVFVGGSVAGEGTYNDLKSNKEYKYTKSLYIIAYGKEGAQLGNLRLSGASVSAWFNFTGSKDEYKGSTKPDLYVDGIALTGKSEEKKKGAVKYFEPVFKVVKLSEKEEEEAEAMQKVIRDYLNRDQSTPDHFEDDTRQVAEQQPVAAGEDDDMDDDLPF